MIDRGRLAALGALLVLAACQPAGSTPATTPTVPGSTTRVESVAPSVPASAPPGADGLPAGFPVPSGAEELPVEEGSALLGRWEVDEPGNRVFDFYTDELPAAGFTVDDVAPGGSAAIFRFTTPDGRQLQLDLIGAQPVRLELGPVHP